MNSKWLIVVTGIVFSATAFAYQIISPIAESRLNTEPVTETPPTEVAEFIPVDPTETAAPTVTPPTPATPAPTQPTTPAPTQPSTENGYTKAQVALHSTKTDCWSIINGSVYDLTAYVPRHPGGSGEILRICGKDGSSLFEGQHGGESKPERILEGYYKGPLL